MVETEREPMPVIRDHREGPVPGPGLYRMPAALYHADPCPEPSLSSSVGKLIVGRSPKHARAAHPRLGAAPDEGDSTRPREIGTAAHLLMLGRGAQVRPIEAGDYKGGAARSERMRALAAGECPILAPDLALAEAAVAEGRRELAAFLPEHPELPELADFLAGEGDAEPGRALRHARRRLRNDRRRPRARPLDAPAGNLCHCRWRVPSAAGRSRIPGCAYA